MCTFSFHPVKAITTAEGGAVTTNSNALAGALRRFRSHGTVRRPELGGWYYEVETLGYNYRLTDMQAALGTSQLTKLERFVTRRNELAERYRDLLSGLPIDLPPAAPPGVRHAYHLFAVRVPERRAVYDALHAAGIAAQVHYVPIYKHPLYAGTGRTGADFPETERAYDGLLSLPLFPALTEAEQDRVVEVLARCLT
jgi:dTDP-4-amino-4,6-dideoxygalactose transaminase